MEARALAGTRACVAAAFAVQGFGLISLTTRLPQITGTWGLSELELSGLLLMMILLAGVGSLAAEKRAAARASGPLLRAGLVVAGAMIGALLLAPTLAVLVAALALYGVALGVVDATSNMQAVAIERVYARPLLPSFHGAWTFGAMVGAATTLATSGLPLQAAAATGLVLVAAAFGRFLPRREQVAAPGTEDVAVRWRPILLVGVAMLIFYMVDTASLTWGATYLDQVFDTPENLVAFATFPYFAASLAARMIGDSAVHRYGAVRVLRLGAVIGAVGLAVIVLAPTWPVAVIGFTVTGLGVAVTAPLSFSAAARIAGGSPARVDAVIGRFNLFNYAGALVGAVLTGVVGQDSLRYGFAVPMVLVLGLVPLARYFAAYAERHDTGPPAPGGARSPRTSGG